jgi:hypothetical protein
MLAKKAAYQSHPLTNFVLQTKICWSFRYPERAARLSPIWWFRSSTERARWSFPVLKNRTAHPSQLRSIFILATEAAHRFYASRFLSPLTNATSIDVQVTFDTRKQRGTSQGSLWFLTSTDRHCIHSTQSRLWCSRRMKHIASGDSHFYRLEPTSHPSSACEILFPTDRAAIVGLQGHLCTPADRTLHYLQHLRKVATQRAGH